MKPRRGQIFLALLLIILGVLFLLDNLDVLAFGDVASTWWPAFLILLGLWQLIGERRGFSSGPLLLIGLGVLFLIVTVGGAGWGVVWPVIIIGVGVLVLFHGRATWRRAPFAAGDDAVDISVLFGGDERRFTSSSFRGGRASAVFGGIELDLRDSSLAQGAVLDVSALFGGVSIRVPESWRVEITGSPLFGGIEDARKQHAATETGAAPVLKISASVTFGGLEIKS